MSDNSIPKGVVTAAQSLLKEAEVARWLNMSTRTIQGLRGKGGGPEFQKLGRSVRYSVASVEDWINARSRSSTSATSPRPPCNIQRNDVPSDFDRGDQS